MIFLNCFSLSSLSLLAFIPALCIAAPAPIVGDLGHRTLTSLHHSTGLTIRGTKYILLEDIHHSLKPATPGWEVETHLFASVEPIDEVSQVLMHLYQSIADGVAQIDLKSTWVEYTTPHFRITIDAGAGPVPGIVTGELVATFAKNMQAWTARRNVVASYQINFINRAAGVMISVSLFCVAFGG